MTKSLSVALFVVLTLAGMAAIVVYRGPAQDKDKLPWGAAAAAGSDAWKDGREKNAAAEVSVQSDSERPAASSSGPWPVATAEKMVFNFGRMQVGQKPGEHRFLIRNDGEADLELVAGKATCQCTSFRVEKPKLAPGEETYAVLTWKLESRNSMFRHGGPVYTNDPKNTTLDFAVEGVVDVAVEFLPSSEWNVGSVYRDRPGKMEATIGSRVHEKFEIKSLTASSKWVHFDVVPLSAEALQKEQFLSGYNVTIEVSSEIPGGTFEDKAVIVLDICEPIFQIPIVARKMGTIRCLPTPGTLFDPETMLLKLGSFSAAQGRSGKIMLVVNQEGLNEPLSITSAEAVPSFLGYKLEPTGDPVGQTRRYFLTVEVPPGRPRVQHTMANLAQLKLNTNHPAGEVIVLDMLFSTN